MLSRLADWLCWRLMDWAAWRNRDVWPYATFRWDRSYGLDENPWLRAAFVRTLGGGWAQYWDCWHPYWDGWHPGRYV